MKQLLRFEYRALLFFPLFVILLCLFHNRFGSALGAAFLLVGFLHIVSEAWRLLVIVWSYMPPISLPSISVRRREEEF